jgi:hypothetical protein
MSAPAATTEGDQHDEGDDVTSPTEQAVLGQILAEVRAVGAKVSSVEVTVAQVVANIEHRANQTDDHEQRIRDLEDLDVVTKEDLEKSQHERMIRFRWMFATGLTIFGLIETAVIAVIVRG